MRSYGQYCAVAKALDVIGDRWTVLIVRELLLRGPSRYTDLRDGLPGIATNLLAERLRALEQAGVLVREDAPPPVATTLFKLTARGEQLRGVLDALGRWGTPFMAEGPAPEDRFRQHWMAWPVQMVLVDSRPQEAPVTIELATGEELRIAIEAAGGEIHARVLRSEHPDAVLAGTPYAILSVLSGGVPLADACEAGLRFEGDERVLARVQPQAIAAAAA
jgi:DNA-binding HxlR family transcriptional regulator